MGSTQKSLQTQSNYLALLDAAKGEPVLVLLLTEARKRVVAKLASMSSPINFAGIVSRFSAAANKEEFARAMSVIDIPSGQLNDFYGRFQKYRLLRRVHEEGRTQLQKLFQEESFAMATLAAIESPAEIDAKYEKLIRATSIQDLKEKMANLGLPTGEENINVRELFAELQLSRLLAKLKTQAPILYGQLLSQRDRVFGYFVEQIREGQLQTAESFDALLNVVQNSEAEPGMIKIAMQNFGVKYR